MKVTCNFCDATAYGNVDDLVLKGWKRMVMRAPLRRTVTACPDHHAEFMTEIEQILVAGKKRVAP